MRGGGAEKKKWGVRKHGTKWGGHKGQADKQNGAGVQGARPRSTETRTVQNGSGEVILLGFAGMPAREWKKKRNIEN